MSAPCIIAVIVTYNRIELLPRCLDSLLKQTRSPDKIVVVNNASTDSTVQILEDRYSDQITRIDMEMNTGGAGGFAAGIEYALSQNPDYVWLMDDDGFASSTSLEELLRHLDDFDILNPLVVTPDGGLAFGLHANGRYTQDPELIRDGSPAGLHVGEINPFNGTLVKAEVFKQIGNVKAEMFIWGDEVEFTYRAISQGKQIATVVNSIFFHPMNRKKIINFGPFRITDCPKNMSHHYFRNTGFYTTRYSGVLKSVSKFFVYSAIFLARGDLSELNKFVSYYLDGARNRYHLEPARSLALQRNQSKTTTEPGRRNLAP